MRKITITAFAVIMAIIIASTALAQQEKMSVTEARKYLKAMQTAVVEAAKIAGPCIVNISAEQTRKSWRLFDIDPFFEEPEGARKSLGSGVIIRADGLIVTNNHVIAGADKIWVTTETNKSFIAKVLGIDPSTDIAVLKIEAENLPALKWGDSDNIEVGEYVIAIGSPYGLKQTVTSGIVSAKGRQDLGIEGIEDFIQTDAAINPGNSGGALIDIYGNLIGINTAIISESGSNSGIGLAIPAKMVKSVVDELTKYGKVRRGWLGIIPSDLRDREGVAVYRIYRDSPAHQSGLTYGDVILEFNGQKVIDSKQLRRLIMSSRPKERVKLKIDSDGSIKTMSLQLDELPQREDGRLIPGL